MRTKFTARFVSECILALTLSLHAQTAPAAESREIADSAGIRLKLIPAGAFIMGSGAGASDEKPVGGVALTKPFYIGATEVTQAQWERVMGNNPSRFKGGNRPVECVSWEDAVEFCRRLSEKEGAEYRLPTEAEWEYACRAGAASEYHWGDKFDDSRCWCNANSGRQTHDAGASGTNAWGLCDMSGNVWEWCADWYRETYPAGERTDPPGPAEGCKRVLRGGSWDANPEGCRSAYRNAEAPSYRAGYVGFRVARGAPRQ